MMDGGASGATRGVRRTASSSEAGAGGVTESKSQSEADNEKS
jgi:hypothetical protein